ncbi:MAG: hypothetical protein P8M30_01070 [Planctomycetaceae bacterium]|jgi:hypothetical protein|nr:hypothetical protein [Planctomycetaceae bacterium]
MRSLIALLLIGTGFLESCHAQSARTSNFAPNSFYWVSPLPETAHTSSNLNLSNSSSLLGNSYNGGGPGEQILWSPSTGTMKASTYYDLGSSIVFNDISEDVRSACGMNRNSDQAIRVRARWGGSTVEILGVLSHEDLQPDVSQGQYRVQFSVADRIDTSGNVVFGQSTTMIYDASEILIKDRVELFRWTSEAGMIGLGFLPGTPTDTEVGLKSNWLIDDANNGNQLLGFSTLWVNGDYRSVPFSWSVQNGLQLQFVFGPRYAISFGQHHLSENGRYLAGSVRVIDAPYDENPPSGSNPVQIHYAFVWDLWQTGRSGLRWVPREEHENIPKVHGVSVSGEVILTVKDDWGTNPVFQRRILWSEIAGRSDLDAIINSSYPQHLALITEKVYGLSPDGTRVVGQSLNLETNALLAFVVDLRGTQQQSPD